MAMNGSMEVEVCLARRRRPVTCYTGLAGGTLARSAQTLRCRPIWRPFGVAQRKALCDGYVAPHIGDLIRRRLTVDAEVGDKAANDVRNVKWSAPHAAPRRRVSINGSKWLWLFT